MNYNGVLEGAFREKDRIVLFGTVKEVDFKNKKVILNVYKKKYIIQIVPSTVNRPEFPFENAKPGDRVYLDMGYDRPFVAERIYFTNNFNSFPRQ